MDALTDLSNIYDAFVGIDVDKKSFSFTIKSDDIMYLTRKIPANPEYLHNYVKKRLVHEKVLYAYEAGPTGYRLYDYLSSKECDCFVISPNSIPKASNEIVKNNRLDSRKLTHYLKSGQLKSIRVPEGAYRQLRHLAKIRENYAINRKVAKQRIKALLLFENLYPQLKDPDSNWSNSYINQLRCIPCSDAVRTRLDMLLMDLDYARKQLLVSHRNLRNFVIEQPSIYKNVRYLKSIPGIGFITAVVILGKIGDPANLKNVRELAGFVGVVPREHSTGDTINKGPISHLGDKRLRSLLIEAAWIAIRRDTELMQFYHRIASKNHPKAASKKAIVAVARKLTYRIYSVLKDQKMYVVH